MKRKLPTIKEFFIVENKQYAIEKARYRKASTLTKSCQTCGYNNRGFCELYKFKINLKYTCDDWISMSELAQQSEKEI